MAHDETNLLEGRIRGVNPFPTLEEVARTDASTLLTAIVGQRTGLDLGVPLPKPTHRGPQDTPAPSSDATTSPPKRRRWNVGSTVVATRPAWSAAIVAFALVLLVGAIFVLGAPFPRGRSPITQVPPTNAPTTTTGPRSTSTIPSTVSTPSTVAVTSELDIAVRDVSWQRVQDSDSTEFADGNIWAMTAGGPGVIAVGSVQTPSGDGYAVDAGVWVSVDGATWQKIDAPDVFGAASGDEGGQRGTQWISGVAAGPDRIVAVGYDGYDAAIWTSADGYDWARVVDNDVLPTNQTDSYIESVTVGGPGFVAVGRQRTDGAIWVSADGLAWDRVVDDALLGDSTGRVGLNDVEAGGPGLVAVGQQGFEQSSLGNQTVPVVMTSVDGTSWLRVPVDPSDDEPDGPHIALPEPLFDRDVSLWRIALSGDRLLSFGFVGTSEGAFFSSDDGSNWEPIAYGPNTPIISGVASWDGGLGAVGASDLQGTQALFVTVDHGATWTKSILSANGELGDVERRGDSVIIAGSYFGEQNDDFRVGIWTGVWGG